MQRFWDWLNARGEYRHHKLRSQVGMQRFWDRLKAREAMSFERQERKREEARAHKSSLEFNKKQRAKECGCSKENDKYVTYRFLALAVVFWALMTSIPEEWWDAVFNWLGTNISSTPGEEPVYVWQSLLMLAFIVLIITWAFKKLVMRREEESK